MSNANPASKTSATSSPFVTDATELRARQTAGHNLSKTRTRERAVEALSNADMGIHAAAVEEEMDGALEAARRALTIALRDSEDRSVRTIAALRTALHAVAEAWAWDLTDTDI